MEPAAIDRRRVLVGGAAGIVAALAAPTAANADAQRLPGDEGPRAWRPTDVPDCDVWFDAARAGGGVWTSGAQGPSGSTAPGLISGRAVLRDGALRATSGAGALVALDGVRTTDYSVGATARLAPQASVVLIARLVDARNHVAARFTRGGGASRVELVTVVGGVESVVATARPGPEGAGPHRLRVDARLNRYRVFVDGRLALDAVDPWGRFARTARSGYGFAAGDRGTRLADVAVSALPGPHDGEALPTVRNLATPRAYAWEREAGSRPIWSATALAGSPALRFDGSSRLTADVTGSPAAATWVAVVQMDEIRAGSIVGTGADGAGGGFELRVNADGTVTGARSGVWEIGTSTARIVAGRPNLVAFLHDASGSWACAVNGEVSGFGYGGWRFGSARTTLAIGYSAPAAVGGFTGLIGEVIRWRRPLRGAELRGVHDRLAARWRVPLAPRVHARTSSPLRVRHVVGSNVSPELGMYGKDPSVWTTFWRDWDWPWVRRSIDRARRSGADSVRIIGDLAAVSSGALPERVYLQRQEQVIRYLARHRMRYYPCGFDLHASPHLSAATVARRLTAVARVYHRHRRTVLGFDLSNELATSYATYGREKALRLIEHAAARVRAAAPGLPLTVSDVGDLNWGMLSRGASLDVYRRLAPHLDFFDVHAYAGTQLRAWHLLPYELSVDRPIVLGEFGEDVQHGGDAKGAAYYAGVRRLRGASSSVAGVFQWAVVEDTCGLWSQTGDHRRARTLAEWRRF